jgi:hypothetical protein
MDLKEQNTQELENIRLTQMREIVNLDIGEKTAEELFAGLSERTRKVIEKTATLLDRHYESRKVLLPIARDMAQLLPDRDYWTNVRVPVQPIGLLPGEAVLRLIVMALPYLLYVGVAHFTGWVFALWGVPAYLGVFFGLDKLLTTAVDNKARRERALDRGRWAFTKLTCSMLKRTGIRDEFVTLDVLNKIRVYGCWTLMLNKLEARDQAAKKARRAAARARRASWLNSDGPGAPAAAKGGANAPRGVEDDDDAFDTVPGMDFPAQWNNPATGLPMVGNSGVDTSGHAMGFGSFGGFD